MGVSLVILFALLVNYLGLVIQPTQAAAPGGEWWDSNYLYRQKITVTEGANSPSGGYNGYTVRFTIDTATDGSKFEDNCDDLRIAHWNGSSWDELDRHVIDNNCNNTATDVRFKLQADITTSDDNYYVYYGYSSAGTPNALSTTNVYIWWDDTSTDRLSSYTVGRGDQWHGTGYTACAYNALGYYESCGDADNVTGSMRRTVNERDVYLEAEFYYDCGWPSNISVGLIARYQIASGTGADELADHYYASSRAELDPTQSCGAAINDTGYAHDGDVVKTTRDTTAIDGTDPSDAANDQYTKQGLAVWRINSTYGKFWNSDTVSGFGPMGWPTVTPLTDGADATDYEGSGDAGIIGAQIAGRYRNILIRRYTEPEPAMELATEEEVPEMVVLMLPLALGVPVIVKYYRRKKRGEHLPKY